MGGRLAVWGNRIKEHDQLIRSLARQAKPQADSFLAILSNFTKISEQSETLGKFVAKTANLEYPQGISDRSPAEVALDVVVRSLSVPRHLMPRDEVALYRSHLRLLLRLQSQNATQVDKLAKAIRENRRCLTRLMRFYTMSEKSTAAKSKAGARKTRKR